MEGVESCPVRERSANAGGGRHTAVYGCQSADKMWNYINYVTPKKQRYNNRYNNTRYNTIQFRLIMTKT